MTSGRARERQRRTCLKGRIVRADWYDVRPAPTNVARGRARPAPVAT